MYTVLMVEDHQETQEILARVLHDAFGSIQITQASTLGQARTRLKAQAFNLALVDIGLPDGSGIDLVAQISRTMPQVYVVVMTIFDDDRHLFAALQAGAHGYLLKEQPHEELVNLLQGIIQGQPPLSPAVARRILQHFQIQTKPLSRCGLTHREREVLTLLAKGLSCKELAYLLGISPHTTADHIKNIYRKLNINSRAEASLEAVRLGLVSPEY
ncbi:MAG: response regulator transcription factor [Gammaproteobacteria bacterium]|nr:response regulator transcription factor [Gammaproteobacteria bacterium]